MIKRRRRQVESIVEYLRTRFDRIRVFVPLAALWALFRSWFKKALPHSPIDDAAGKSATSGPSHVQ
jgi:hypothetical protein